MFDFSFPAQRLDAIGFLRDRTPSRLFPYRDLIAGAALTTAGFALLALYGRTSPVAPRYLDHVPYCEALGGGLFAQPVNTFSNIYYSLVGLFALFLAGRDRAPLNLGSSHRTQVGSVLGWVALLLGLGSAAFHGTLSHWGGLLDNVAMNLLVSFVIVHDITRLEGWSRKTFTLLYTAVNALTTAVLLHDDSHSLVLFALLVLAAGLAECMVVCPAWFPWTSHRVVGRRVPYLGGALATFALAWGIWRLSDTGAALCASDSLLQGHALWHLLTAVTVGLLILYLRSERETVPSHAGSEGAVLGLGARGSAAG
jgi:hypothetical protein